MTDLAAEARAAAEQLFAWAKDRNFEGYDPYDALNSPIVRAAAFGTRWGRIAWTQLLRRSPVNLRPLLGIKPGANPKALGLFLESSVKLGDRAAAESLVDRLAALRSPNAPGAAWGYNFPWQNRFQLLPRLTPTAVNTAFIGHALLDCYDAFQTRRALELALATADFFLGALRRKPDEDGAFCFSYTPLDGNYVHNANVLAASLLARLAARHGVEKARKPALNALEYTLRRQRPDGSWFYAERQEQRWIDSFHTGFVLEALRRFLNLGMADGAAGAYRKGVEFYAENFFLTDGTPKYYCDRLYTVDIHAPAEAVCFFSGAGPEYRALADRVLLWTLRNMRDARTGVFYYRKSRLWTIKTPYMRWSQAWSLRALSEYITQTNAERKSE